MFCCALALLALGVSGCGAEDHGAASIAPPPPPVVGQGLPPEVQHPVTEAVDRLQRAFAERDYADFCRSVTPRAARDAGLAAHGKATTCERDVRRLFNLIRKGSGWRHVNAPRVINVDVQGTTATAIVALDRRWRAQIALANRSGRWRLDGLFGTPSGGVLRRAEQTVDNAFRRGSSPYLKVEDGSGKPCPDVSESDYRIRGGCQAEVKGRIAPITMLTPFGDFEFARCAISYRVRVDAAGRTWTEQFEVAGDAKSVACGDVGSCFEGDRTVPWPGRISPDGNGGFIHRMDACISTCVGHFVGKLNMRLLRDGDRWKAVPIHGGGSTGFRLDNPLVMSGSLALEELPRG